MVSIVICSGDEGKFEAVSQQYAAALPAGRVEIVRIADARSLAEGYNRGIERSTGEIVVFSHDDVEIVSDDLEGKLKAAMGEFDLVGVAGPTA
jgi:hypothetical protein